MPLPEPLHRTAAAARPRLRGFTLAELLLAMLIAALLAAIALPAYRQYLERGHRAEARAALLQAAQWMERAATASGSYPPTAALPDGLRSTPSGRYAIELASPPAGATAGTAFTLTARPLGSQAQDGCGSLTLTHHGVRGASATARVADCWNR